mmetsp:Transcript_17976/g.50689  ORF Transcript_17976/g.50689 Transcript_17976/m.50689 type:complete len:227 (-) Transcript_17976:266-946(-)
MGRLGLLLEAWEAPAPPALQREGRVDGLRGGSRGRSAAEQPPLSRGLRRGVHSQHRQPPEFLGHGLGGGPEVAQRGLVDTRVSHPERRVGCLAGQRFVAQHDLVPVHHPRVSAARQGHLSVDHALEVLRAPRAGALPLEEGERAPLAGTLGGIVAAHLVAENRFEERGHLCQHGPPRRGLWVCYETGVAHHCRASFQRRLVRRIPRRVVGVLGQCQGGGVGPKLCA